MQFITKCSSRDIIGLRDSERDAYDPFMDTKNCETSCSFRGAKLWNNVKPSSKNAQSRLALKRAKKHYRL